GNYSFAAGVTAQAGHDHSFVWNGWSAGFGPSFRSNGAAFLGENGLSVDYCSRRNDGTGGGTCWVYFGPNGNKVITSSTGAYLSTGGVWQDNSDKHSKTAFAPIKPQAVLAKVVALPVTTWQYKAEPAAVRHLGPMAQDFHAAFKLGQDDTSIATLDEAGVALAAIQGLNQKLEAENAKLKTRLAELEAKVATQAKVQARVETLEARLDALFHARASQH
ncbi:MAG: tail fiber domain-containing protein, partial [Gammaproteobacteria bacterium]